MGPWEIRGRRKDIDYITSKTYKWKRECLVLTLRGGEVEKIEFIFFNFITCTELRFAEGKFYSPNEQLFFWRAHSVGSMRQEAPGLTRLGQVAGQSQNICLPIVTSSSSTARNLCSCRCYSRPMAN